MKIVSLFNRRTFKPSWTFTPKGSIWRLLTTESAEFVGEARDQEQKLVSFFALNSDTGVPLWSDRGLDEPWWAGIEIASNGVVLLHKFATPDMPQHKGILALDLRTGAQLWENKELTYWFVRNGSVIAHKMAFEKRIIAELDLKTGQIKRELDETADPMLLSDRIKAESGVSAGLVFPEILSPESFDSAQMRLIRRELPSKGIHGDAEYVVAADFVAMNYHLRSQRSTEETVLLDNHFKILDTKTSKVVYEDTIARDARAAVPDSFFLWNGTAYYIKDQKTLTAVKFSDEG